MQKIYNSQAVDKIVDRYINRGGEIEVIKEGCLLEYGLAICLGDKLKYFIIKEIYLNEWSSGYIVRFYNKLPKKYELLRV